MPCLPIRHPPDLQRGQGPSLSRRRRRNEHDMSVSAERAISEKSIYADTRLLTSGESMLALSAARPLLASKTSLFHYMILFSCSPVLTPIRDVLRRHVNEHSSTSRRTKACDACHANKTKCDGGEQCSLCRRRGTACHYSSSDPDQLLLDAEPNEDVVAEGSEATQVIATNDETERSAPVAEAAPAIVAAPVVPSEGPAATLSATTPSRHTGELQSKGNSSELQRALESIRDELDKQKDQRLPLRHGRFPVELTDGVMQKYLQFFHPHWLLLHAPSYELWGQFFENAATVFLIGGFFWNQADETMGIPTSLFLQIHEKLVDHFIKSTVSPVRPLVPPLPALTLPSPSVQPWTSRPSPGPSKRSNLFFS